MASLCMKRLSKERERFTKDDTEFWVNWKDDNLRKFEAYIVGPDDSVYKGKLIKLRFDIPSNYPIVPPKVTFIQHTGNRVHPNLYTEGKVCLSILGTWSGPSWSQNMTIESILRTLRSLLDDNPYRHEPNQTDRPEFNAYVRYHGRRWLLLDYVERETDPDAKAWLNKYMQEHGKGMLAELERQRDANRNGTGIAMQNPYAPHVRFTVDFNGLISDLRGRLPSVMVAAEESTAGGQAMEEAKMKRKLPFASEHGPQLQAGPPAKRQHVALAMENPSRGAPPPPTQRQLSKPTAEVIDLTDD